MKLSRRTLLLGGSAALIGGARTAWSQSDSEDLWSALKQGGLLLFMRHANAPGSGDDATIRIDDCSTQRNLGELGREQARRIGGEFRRRGIAIASVQSSRWCRCLETARLAFDTAEPFDLLNSFFSAAERGEPQTVALREHLARLPASTGNRVFVTHFVNINALLGVGTADANIHLVRRDDRTLQRLGTLTPP